VFTRILVPLDGSGRAERALPVAARIARATRGTLLFVQVVSPTAYVGIGFVTPVDTVQAQLQAA